MPATMTLPRRENCWVASGSLSPALTPSWPWPLSPKTWARSRSVPKVAPGRSRRTFDCLRTGTMDDMLVNPRPGTTPEQLQKILQEQHGAVSGLSTGHQGSAQDKLGAYLEWTANAVRQLARPISPAD